MFESWRQNFVHFEENSELYFLKDFTESAANAPMYFKLKDDISSCFEQNA